MLQRDLNREIAALRVIGAQVLAAALAPDAPAPTSGYGAGLSGGDGSVMEATPRSFLTADGATSSQMFTELDLTEGDAASM